MCSVYAVAAAVAAAAAVVPAAAAAAAARAIGLKPLPQRRTSQLSK